MHMSVSFIYELKINMVFTKYPPFNLGIFGSLIFQNSSATICKPYNDLDETSLIIQDDLIFPTSFFLLAGMVWLIEADLYVIFHLSLILQVIPYYTPYQTPLSKS